MSRSPRSTPAPGPALWLVVAGLAALTGLVGYLSVFWAMSQAAAVYDGTHETLRAVSFLLPASVVPIGLGIGWVTSGRIAPRARIPDRTAFALAGGLAAGTVLFLWDGLMAGGF